MVQHAHLPADFCVQSSSTSKRHCLFIEFKTAQHCTGSNQVQIVCMVPRAACASNALPTSPLCACCWVIYAKTAFAGQLDDTFDDTFANMLSRANKAGILKGQFKGQSLQLPALQAFHRCRQPWNPITAQLKRHESQLPQEEAHRVGP